MPTLKLAISIVVLSLVASSVAQSAEPPGAAESLAGKRIVFLGDSITQAGGYVSFTAFYLERQYPDKQFEVFGLGLASETLSGLSEPNHAGGRFPRPCLFERLGRLLEKTQPDIVIACYGMNDGIYLPLDDERFAAFQGGVEKLIAQCQAGGVEQIYLVTPPIYDFPAEGQGFDYDTVLTTYAAWEMSIDKAGVVAIDLHTPMKKARAARTEVFSKDRVHPGDEGHLFMAQTILAELGLEVPVEPLAAIKSDPLFQQVDRLRRHRSSRWMPHIGYTREKAVPPQPLGDTQAEAAKIRERIEALKPGA